MSQRTPGDSEIINGDLQLNQIERLYPQVRQGLNPRRVVTFRRGELLYKFADAQRSPTQQVASPWWFSEQAFHFIKQYLQLAPSNQGFVARSLAAVQYQWSEMNVLVQATVQFPIRAFAGPGEMQVEKTAHNSWITYQPCQELEQAYLPNIIDEQTRALNANGLKALGLFRHHPISSGDSIDQTIRTLKGKMVMIPGKPTFH